MSLWFEQFFALCRRYPVAVISLSLVAVLGVADYFLWQHTAALAARSERVRQEGETMLLSLSNQSRLEANHAVVLEALKAIDQNLITEADLAGNLDYFYQIEKVARIRLSAISQLSAPVAANSPYRAIPFSLRLTGPYAPLLAYLHELETGPRLLRVRTYHFSQSDPAADQLSLDLTVDVLGHP